MTRSRFPAGPAPRRLPLAAWLVACLLCLDVTAAPQGTAAPPGAPQSPTAGATGGKPTSRPARADMGPSAPVETPASQPVVARSEVDQRAIRREVPRSEMARSAQTATNDEPRAPGFDLPRVLGALAVVLGLIFTLRWLLRRSMNPAFVPGATNAVQVLTRSPLSPRQQLLLVRVGRRLLVVSDCNGQLNSLSEITDADEVAALVGQLRDEKLTSASRSFGNLLGIWRRGGVDVRDDDTVDDGTAAVPEEYPRAAPDVPEHRDGGDAEEGDDPSVSSARNEIHGLLERVRNISHQLKRQ